MDGALGAVLGISDLWLIAAAADECVSDFDYMASAELLAAHGRSGLRYRRFPHAAEAIRYAIEKLPATVLSATSIEVREKRYGAIQIRALYESDGYPLARR